MRLNDISLPYPILGVGDDIRSNVSLVSPSIRKENDGYIISCGVMTDNSDILSLINEGKAEYVCEVSCQRTFLRKCHKQSSPNFEIKIPNNSVNGRIEFEVTITVKEPIANYVNSNFHEDYEGYVFNLEKGDLLVYVGLFWYDVEIKYNDLDKYSSFMEFERAEAGAMTTSVNLDNHKIRVRLPELIYNKYRDGVAKGTEYEGIIHCSLVMNALLQALYNFDKYPDKLWARTLDYRLKTEQELSLFCGEGSEEGVPFDKEYVGEIAQVLLGDPYRRMFECIDYIANSTTDSEED